MSSYKAYGHTFTIDRPLHYVNKSVKSSPEFNVYSSDNLNFTHRKIGTDVAEYHKDGIGKFRVTNGNKIEYFVNTDEEGSFEKNLLYLAIPIIFYQRNYLVLHSSCIHIKGKTVMFCGRKGSGKSTYCNHYLSKDGFIAEDRCVIDTFGKEQRVKNSEISILKLKSISKTNKNFIINKIPMHEDGLGRSCYELDDSVHNKKINDYKIDYCIFLDWGEELTLKKLDFESIFFYSFNNSLKTQDVDIKRDSEKKHLINLNNFCSSNINFYKLSKPRGSDSTEFDLSTKLLDQILFE